MSEITVLQAKTMHSEGASLEKIGEYLDLPLALVEEYVESPVEDILSLELIKIPLLYDEVPPEELKARLNGYGAFIAKESMANINKPNAIQALGRVSVILNNVQALLERTTIKTDGEVANGLNEYLQD